MPLSYGVLLFGIVYLPTFIFSCPVIGIGLFRRTLEMMLCFLDHSFVVNTPLFNYFDDYPGCSLNGIYDT